MTFILVMALLARLLQAETCDDKQCPMDSSSSEESSSSSEDSDSAEDYELHEDGSFKFEPCPETTGLDAPIGKTIVEERFLSKTYPRARHKVYIHIPAKKAEVYNVMFLLDGSHFYSAGLHKVLDVMTHRNEIEPTVGIFIDPGQDRTWAEDRDIEQEFAEAVMAEDWELLESIYSQFPRQYEYDHVSAKYVTFLEEDILPLVKAKLPSGSKLASDPAKRSIFGASSGGLAAVVAAWYRPDFVARVITTIPSFINLAHSPRDPNPPVAGYQFPYMVRETERKAIKIYMQSGSKDLSIDAGDWPAAFRVMEKALEFKGYDFKAEFVEGAGHNFDYFVHQAPRMFRWALGGDILEAEE